MFLFGLGKNNQTGWDLQKAKDKDETERKISEGIANAMMFPAKLAMQQARFEHERSQREFERKQEQSKRDMEAAIRKSDEAIRRAQLAEKIRLESVDREERLIASMNNLAVEIRELNRLKRFGPK